MSPRRPRRDRQLDKPLGQCGRPLSLVAGAHWSGLMPLTGSPSRCSAVKNLVDSSIYFRSVEGLLKQAISIRDHMNARPRATGSCWDRPPLLPSASLLQGLRCSARNCAFSLLKQRPFLVSQWLVTSFCPLLSVAGVESSPPPAPARCCVLGLGAGGTAVTETGCSQPHGEAHGSQVDTGQTRTFQIHVEEEKGPPLRRQRCKQEA